MNLKLPAFTTTELQKLTDREQDRILIRCLHQGCPRTRRVPRHICKNLPPSVTEIHSFCPWHDTRCDKAYPEVWFDAHGNQVQEDQ